MSGGSNGDGGSGKGGTTSSRNASVSTSSLSRVMSMLVEQLHSSQSRDVLIGCYHALSVLTQRASMANTGDLHVSDVIPLTLDHLRVPWMAQELPTHVNMLSVIGSISRNAPAVQFQPYTGQLLNHVLRVCHFGFFALSSRRLDHV